MNENVSVCVIIHQMGIYTPHLVQRNKAQTSKMILRRSSGEAAPPYGAVAPIEAEVKSFGAEQVGEGAPPFGEVAPNSGADAPNSRQNFISHV